MNRSPGEECNTKVIGARYFSSTYKSQTPPAQRTDFLSPRDGDGHGTHVASTAAGNAGVSASVAGHSFGKISGVAPAAKLAIYKVAFTSKTDPEAVVYTGDALAAIDAAISDGVDVINYSVSSSDTLDDPVDRAYLSAASAGIFVATARGNAGPGRGYLEPRRPLGDHRRCEHGCAVRGNRCAGQRQEVRRDQHNCLREGRPGPTVTARSVKRASAAGGDADRMRIGHPQSRQGRRQDRGLRPRRGGSG